MVVFPNAKINIGLNVLRKRADNYHDIQSVFFPIPLYDILEVVVDEKIDDFNFLNTGITIDAPPEKNLVVKVYKTLKMEYNLPPVKIHLHKAIPFGAGLGGGSSDASFMIKLLNDIFNLKLSLQQMLKYAKKMGADCPFFIENIPAYVSGIGDKLETIDFSLNKYKIILSKPKINLNTSKMYDLITPNEKVFNLKQITELPIKEWKNHIHNDFEKAIFKNQSEVYELKKMFYDKKALFASMTGSGSTVFGLFEKNSHINIDQFNSGFIWGSSNLL